MDNQLRCPAPFNHTGYPHPSPLYAQFSVSGVPIFKEADFITPEELQQKIEAQSLNIGFVLGQQLRYLWDASADFLRNGYSWLKETRRNFFLDYDELDFDFYAHQNINAEECVPERKEQCEPEYPQAIVVRGNYFRDIFGIEEYVDEKMIQNSLRNQFFLNSLAKKHRLHDVRISSVHELCELVEKVSKLGSIKLLYISAHGNPTDIWLSDTANQRKGIIDIFDYYYYNIGAQDLFCLSLLAKNSVIILDSCNNAGGHNIGIDNNPYTFSTNIQKLVALHAVNSKVFAADFYVFKNSVFLKDDTSFEVYAHGVKTDSFIELVKIPLSFLFYIFGEIPVVNYLGMRRLEEISAEKADFCKGVLPYFSMKRFCDNAKIKPIDKALEACNKDPKCEEAVNILSFIDLKTRSQCKVDF